MDIRDKIRTEGMECVFCKSIMQMIPEIQQLSSQTDEFVCSNCGFTANFVKRETGYYFGVLMRS
jgi:hypothetical protein